MSIDTVSNVSLFDRNCCCHFNEISLFGNENTLFKSMDLKLLSSKFDNTDKSIVKLIANQNLLYRVADSFKQATNSFNNLKNYYFMFDAYPLKSKKLYNGTQIHRFNNALLTNRVNFKEKYYTEYNYLHKNNNDLYLKIKLDDIDILYLTYFNDANYYIKLYESIGYARNNLGKLKNYYFKYKYPPNIFKNTPKIKNKIYCGEDLVKLFIFASNKNYLLQYYSNWKLPDPLLQDYNKIYKQCCLYSTGIPNYNNITKNNKNNKKI
jgi:hypothetical protein